MIVFFQRRPIVWLSVLLSAPLIVGLIAVVGTRWYPTGDMAQAELHVRGIWRHVPLVGAAGRIESDLGVQGSHPGPALWFALWPIYALFGRTSLGLLVSATVLHVAALSAVVAIAARRGGRRFAALLTVGLLLVVRSSGPHAFVEPWNPWFAVVPYALFLLALWSALESSPRWLIAAVVLGSYCIHCHAGYVVVVGVPLVATALVVARASASRRSLALLVGQCALAGVVMWAAPLADQLRRTPGNVSILLQHFGSPDEPTLAGGTALRIIASQLSVLGPWLTGPSLISRNALGVLVTLALWGWAVRSAWRRHDRTSLHLHLVVASAVIAAVISVLRIFGPYQEYTIRWFWVLTAVLLARIATDVSHGWRFDRRQVIVGLCALIGASSVTSAQFADRADTSSVIDSQFMAALVDETRAGLAEDGRYLVRWHDPVGLGALPFGLVLELERDGRTMGVDAPFAAAALPHRVMPEASADAIMWVVAGERIAEFRSDPAAREIAFADLRSPDEQRRSDELRALLRERFDELGTPEDYRLLDEQYGAVSLMFRTPQPPQDIADAVREFVGLRMPVAVFVIDVE